ncbi:MAG: hypothetical protein ACOCQX_02985 [Candidatus Nanoarchaeia archaeon]
MEQYNIDENSVFIKLNEYKESLSLFEQLKNKTGEIKDTLQKIETLKQEENAEIELWNNSLKELEKKINHIDSLMIDKKH